MIICCANQKGGVGKTTTVITLGHGLAMRGYRVLLVDVDPQGHIAIALGLKKAPGILRLLSYQDPLDTLVQEARPNLWILPSDSTTERAKRDLMSMDYRERVLKTALRDADFDVILIDTAPSYDVLHVSALVASRRLLIPTKLDSLAVDGVNEILRASATLRQYGDAPEAFSVLPTFFDRVTRETMLQLHDLVTHFAAQVWPPIPQDVRAREAPAYGQTLWEYSPGSAAVTGYGNGDKVGGYASTLDRLEKMLNA